LYKTAGVSEVLVKFLWML